MAAIVRMSSKGQITIPVELRARLGADRGDRLSLEMEDDRLVISRVRDLDDLSDLVTGWIAEVPPITDVSAYYDGHRDRSE